VARAPGKDRQPPPFPGSTDAYGVALLQSENSVITLCGSRDIIVEFFHYAVSSILYQRGIYPPEDFDRIPKYGLALQVPSEQGLVTYMANVLNQLKGECPPWSDRTARTN
jgi:hypothetical protein